MCGTADEPPGSAGEALRLAAAALDYLNSPAADDLPAAATGEVLAALEVLRAKLTAARACSLRRFDAAGAHDADGYATPAAWRAARAKLARGDARAAVRQMRQLTARPHLEQSMAAGVITESWTTQLIRWTKDLPADLREGTDQILAGAAAAGASLDDLAAIAAYAIEQWRASHPDPDEDGFDERYVQVGTTFGGAGVIRGDLTPECAAAVEAVLEALGKKHGPEDHRSEGQRFHDALQLGCELLIRAKMVPDRAGADTQVSVHIPLSWLREMPGASELEQAWINAQLGDPGYLTGKDAEAAACDALTVPVVTGHADMHVIDQIIDLAPAAGDDGRPERPRSRPLSPAAWQALRHAIARLAVEFVSGPNGLAAALRTGLLQAPYNTPSLPLDIGYSDSIPASIRRAVRLRDKH